MRNWPEVPLAELADIRISNVDKKAFSFESPVRLCNYMDVYANNYIRADLAFMEATATASEIRRFKVERGDVLITKDSETPDDIGIPAVIMDDVDDLVCGYHLALLKPHKDFVDSVYLCKQLATTRIARYFGRYAAGSTRYGLSNGAVAKTRIPIAPLPVQRKIAAILVALDAAIGKTEALIAKYQHIKAGLMHDLFTRGVLPNGQLRPPREQAPELYRETAIGWIPTDWETNGLATKNRPDTSWLRTGPFGSSLKGEHWRTEGNPVITIGSLGIGDFIADELLYVDDKDAARLKEFQLQEGDVVFSRVADVGRSVVIRALQATWIMSSNLMRIAVDAKKLRPDYLQLQLAGDERVKREMRKRVNSAGRDVANSDVLDQLRFAWPTIQEQDRIIAAITRVSDALACELCKVEKLRKQKLGLMQDLLTGKVQVKVPTLEPEPA